MGGVNNSLTGGMKQPQRVFGAVWLEGRAAWCGVVWRGAAQRLGHTSR